MVPTIEELIDQDKRLEKRHRELTPLDLSEDHEFISDIELYVRNLEDKISDLSGRKNKRMLEKIIKKWRDVLNEIAEVDRVFEIISSSKIDSAAMARVPRKPVPETFERKFEEWALQIQYKASNLISERKIDPGFSQKMVTSDPQLAEIIESMYPN
ncbi:MAG TPA: hypothetical protein VGA94_03740 [Thermodesulfobacteriota bacterium]|jgi:hypothetical protein